MYPEKPLQQWKENWFANMMANSAFHIYRYFCLLPICVQCLVITTKLSPRVKHLGYACFLTAKPNRIPLSSVCVCVCDNIATLINLPFTLTHVAHSVYVCRICAYTFLPPAYWLFSFYMIRPTTPHPILGEKIFADFLGLFLLLLWHYLTSFLY